MTQVGVAGSRIAHESPAEQARLHSLLRIIPPHGHAFLDVGGREGWISDRVRERFDRCLIVDLLRDERHHPTVQASVVQLPFRDRSADVVLCAEVLEHVPPPQLSCAATELQRVTDGMLIVGVPDRQDLRVGRWKCQACGRINPPYGHLNRFDRNSLAALFPAFVVTAVEHVWPQPRPATNAIAATVLDWAGNPYGTYGQLEGCISCGRRPTRPTLGLGQRAVAKGVSIVTSLQRRRRPTWIHLQLQRR